MAKKKKLANDPGLFLPKYRNSHTIVDKIIELEYNTKYSSIGIRAECPK